MVVPEVFLSEPELYRPIYAPGAIRNMLDRLSTAIFVCFSFAAATRGEARLLQKATPVARRLQRSTVVLGYSAYELATRSQRPKGRRSRRNGR
jgi:hypothetical protein